MTRRKTKVKPIYQHEYDRAVRTWREKRKFLRRLLDLMDQDDTGHEWPGIWWNETINDIQALTFEVCMMRRCAKDREEPLEGVPRE